MHCYKKCQDDPKCLSFNFKYALSLPSKNCELNGVTKRQDPNNYVKRPGYIYYENVEYWTIEVNREPLWLSQRLGQLRSISNNCVATVHWNSSQPPNRSTADPFLQLDCLNELFAECDVMVTVCVCCQMNIYWIHVLVSCLYIFLFGNEGKISE